MVARKGPRLSGRDGEIWVAYISGVTQTELAKKHGLGQQRVSEILKEVRKEIGEEDRTHVKEEHLEAVRMIRRSMMALALNGDVGAARETRQLLAHHAKVLGLYAPEALAVTVQKQVDLDGSLVADALTAALDSLGLSHDDRMRALSAAHARLLGDEGPALPTAPVIVDDSADQLQAILDDIHETYPDDEDGDDDESE